MSGALPSRRLGAQEELLQYELGHPATSIAASNPDVNRKPVGPCDKPATAKGWKLQAEKLRLSSICLEKSFVTRSGGSVSHTSTLELNRKGADTIVLLQRRVIYGTKHLTCAPIRVTDMTSLAVSRAAAVSSVSQPMYTKESVRRYGTVYKKYVFVLSMLGYGIQGLQ